MKELKTVWRWWWGWAPEKIENWLEQMELDGWNLFQVNSQGIRFHFTRGEKRRIRYCVDFQERMDDEYVRLFQDTGWKLAWVGARGWCLWSCEYSGERPDIYTDVNSLIERNNRLSKFISPIFALECLIFLIFFVFNQSDNDFIRGFRVGFGSALLVFMPFQIYIVVQLMRHNYKLLKRKTLSDK